MANEVFVGSVFLGLETFLDKTARLEILDGLFFNYKMKEFPVNDRINRSKLLHEFWEIVNELKYQLQDVLQKYATELESRTAVEIIEDVLGDNNSSNSEQRCEDKQLVTVVQDDTESDHQEAADPLDCSEMNEPLKTRRKTPTKKCYTGNSSNMVKTDCVGTRESKTRCDARVRKSTRSVKDQSSHCEWDCGSCSRIFSSRARLVAHLTQVHHHEVSNDAALGECTMASCGPQGESEIERATLEKDLELDRASLLVFCCSNCATTYKSMEELVEHECQVYKDDCVSMMPPAGGERLVRHWDVLRALRSLVCGQCQEEYRSLQRMVFHLPLCKPGPYSCELCRTDFVSMKELNYHKKKHHVGEKSFFCKICNVSFQRRASLQKHEVKRHEGNQGPFSCEDCNEVFEKKILLTFHREKVHTLEKNFLCQVCGNKFCTPGSLKAHLNTHASGQIKFPCQFCSKVFGKKEKLVFHTRIHTGERPYVCSLCSKKFIGKQRLMEHMRRHRGEKRFSCQHCSKKYAARWDLRQHIKKVHSADIKDEEDLSGAEDSNPATPQQLPVPQKLEPPTVELISPAVPSGPTIITVEPLELLSSLERAQTVTPLVAHPLTSSVGPTQFLVPASTVQIQVPISVAGQSFDLTCAPGQQLLLSTLAGLDVNTISTFQFQ